MRPDAPRRAFGPPDGYDPTSERIAHLFDLTDKVALVTGGGAGIGRAIALGMARFGAAVVVIDRDAGAAETVAQEIATIGRTATAHVADVTDPAGMVALARSVRDSLGGLDICVASAGGGMRRSIIETDPTDWQRVIDLNLAGTWNTARAVGPLLMERGGGKFISIASMHGHVADPDLSAYAPAKAAVVQLTRVLALEWAPYGISVNSIAPSHIRTQRTRALEEDPAEYARIVAKSPIGRFGEPWEIIGPAVFLASDASSLVTGHSLLVDGGWTIT
jgi:NAD(P)-dependent dehydrogenase (short-subunit alcohol dehydrogenase family)